MSDNRQRAEKLLRGFLRIEPDDDWIDDTATALAEAEQRGVARAVQPFRALADSLAGQDAYSLMAARDIRAVADQVDRGG